MKVFLVTSTGSLELLDEEKIYNSEYFSKSEKEVLGMFHNWIKIGFAVKYYGISQEREEPTDMQYSVLFLGTEQVNYSISIGSIIIPQDECNVSKAIHGMEGLIQRFFNAVYLVKKQGSE